MASESFVFSALSLGSCGRSWPAVFTRATPFRVRTSETICEASASRRALACSISEKDLGWRKYSNPATWLLGITVGSFWRSTPAKYPASPDAATQASMAKAASGLPTGCITRHC
jgi:hypothetical protein